MENINLNNFHIGKYLRKIYTAEILDLDDFTSGKCLETFSLPCIRTAICDLT